MHLLSDIMLRSGIGIFLCDSIRCFLTLVTPSNSVFGFISFLILLDACFFRVVLFRLLFKVPTAKRSEPLVSCQILALYKPLL